MNRILLAALTLAMASSANAAERRYTVTDFDRVQVEGPFDVTLSTGKAGSAVATGSEAAVERVSIEVQGGVLKIRPNKSAWGGYPGEGAGPVKISVSTHDLRAVTVIGTGSLSVDKANAMRFDAALAGSGNLTIASLQADVLNVGLMGTGRITLAGKAKTMRANIQGNGSLAAQALVAEDAQLQAATTGDVALAVHHAADVTSNGQGDTTIIGSPACTVKALGSGRVVCGRASQAF